MSGASSKILTFGKDGNQWSLTDADTARQAIAPLRGYAYQLHQSAAAWIALPDGDQLYLEVAEDYAQIAAHPERLQEVLNATQIKDTRESGAVTLNSADVHDAILHLVALQDANPGRLVNVTFLTTSPVGQERKAPLASGVAGIEAWRLASTGGDVSEIREALKTRFVDGRLAVLLASASDEEFRSQILQRLTFVCGAANWEEVEATNRAALVSMRHAVNASPDIAERAYDSILASVLRAILASKDRMLDRAKLLECLFRATSIALPSQTVVDLVTKLAAPASPPVSELDEDKLRTLSQALLDLGQPPALLSLFPDAPATAHAALNGISRLDRTLTSGSATQQQTANIRSLSASPERHHLIIGPPGSGKTHALWHDAERLLKTGAAIPLFLSVRELTTWNDVLNAVTDLAPSIDVTALFRNPKVCVFLDGWSEFAVGKAFSEKAKAFRALHGTRVVATARQATISDTMFKAWLLEMLAPIHVRQVIQQAFPGAALPEQNILDFLRSPLALTLFIVLGGTPTSRGELISQLHRHLASELPEAFDRALSGTVASMSLAHDRSFSRFVAELRERSRVEHVAEPTQLLERLGTISARGSQARPFHDLYWSWLSGLGYLQEGRGFEALGNLDAHESFSLALQSGLRASKALIIQAANTDAVLAAEFDVSLNAPSMDQALEAQINSMFADPRLSVRCRAAVAGLRSRQPNVRHHRL